MTDRDDATDTTEADADATGVTEATKREGHLASDRPGRRKEPDAYLERGTLVGRYVVLEKLGEGGMGVVYSAFDPELDRKVAIKLLQAKSGGSESAGGQAWLLREAQALARLAHPNVVSVHDVGTLPGERVFVAMELVDGLTLRKWLKAQPRTWREVMPVLLAAGAGLAAAHAAGLVHRDFKPDNVLVGNDGRVRVMDFGLARLRPGGDTGPVPRSSASELNQEGKSGSSPLSDSLTKVGSVVGTPAYMAPEIYAGQSADAASDQFAFGVTLFEALFRSRPFTKEQLTPPRAVAPRPTIPDKTRVPARIQRAVLRAISIEPAQRFPSVEAMLAELAIDPTALRKKIAIAGGLVAAAAAAFTLSIATRERAAEPCRGIEQRLAGVWDTAIKKKVREGYIATKHSSAAESFARVESALDKYTGEWAATAIDSCKATRLRKDQTEDVMMLRQECLDLRLEELRSLSTVMAEPDEKLVDKGEKAAVELEPLAGCSNVAMLRAPGSPPAELRAKIAEIRKHLADAKANVIAGKKLPAMIASQKALDAAKLTGFEPVQAEALVVRGATAAFAGNSQESAALAIEAVRLALRTRRDDLVAVAAMTAGLWTAEAQGKPGEGKVWLALADAFAERTGQDRALEQRLASARGMVAALGGDSKTAIEAHEKAFEVAVRMHGRESPEIWNDELLLATTLTKALAYERAVAHFEHALALREKAVGADHIDVALMLSNLGIAYRHVGEGKKARAAYERTIAIREKRFGKNNPILVAPLVNFADLLNHEGESAAALPVIERAERLARVLPGVDHPIYHETVATRAEVLGKLGRVAEARKAFDEVLAIEIRVSSSVLPTTQAVRAELELAQKAFSDAIAWAEKSIRGFEAAGGNENPELWRPLMALGQAKLGQGDRVGARRVLERAVAIGVKAGMGEYELRDLRAALASAR